MIRFAFLSAVLLAAEGCPPSPTPPRPDASDAGPTPAPDASTPAVTACARMAAIGCEEGTASNCAATLDHIAATRLTRIDIPCLVAATSKAGVRACGSVACK